MIKKILLGVVVIAVLLVLVIMFGLNKKYEAINYQTNFSIPPLSELDAFVAKKEADYSLRADNQARIIWNDSIPSKTEYALVYLHGFGASPQEANPTHRQIAKQYGMNLYLARIDGHGSNEEYMMLNMTPNSMMNSALEAIAIGKRIGEKVIIMSTSTGATYATGIMANDPSIHAAINYSPNYDLADPNTHILLKPFGLQIARLLSGGKLRSWNPPAEAAPYWTTTYRLEATLALRALINMVMTEENIKAIKQPMLNVAYYKDDENQDDVVSVPAMETVHQQLGTDDAKKRFVKLPDVGTHIMSNPIFSKDIESVKRVTEQFMEEVLKIEKIRS